MIICNDNFIKAVRKNQLNIWFDIFGYYFFLKRAKGRATRISVMPAAAIIIAVSVLQ